MLYAASAAELIGEGFDGAAFAADYDNFEAIMVIEMDVQ